MARALHALLDLSKALSAEVDLGSVLDVVGEKASAVVEAERTTISLSDHVRKLSNTGSTLSAPVIDSTGMIVGVIESINKKSGARFDSADEELMLAMASHIAVAIERARLTSAFLEHERLAEGLKLASEIQMRMLPSAATFPGESAPVEIHAYIRCMISR